MYRETTDSPVLTRVTAERRLSLRSVVVVIARAIRKHWLIDPQTFLIYSLRLEGLEESEYIFVSVNWVRTVGEKYKP